VSTIPENLVGKIGPAGPELVGLRGIIKNFKKKNIKINGSIIYIPHAGMAG